ncbi:spore germination protein KC [Paenibacillus intestini]|nr:spore germination protein KC [Paenibacillus intestini]
MNELAIPLAMGIDKTPDTNEYTFSLQVVNAREIAGQQAGGSGVPVVLYSANGTTLLEAIRKASKKVPRRLTVEHVRDFIIGEELAREGMGEVFDFMERDAEPRLKTRVFIAKGSRAEIVLKTLTPLENIPANSMLGELQTTADFLGETYEAGVDDVIRGLLVKGGGPVISGIHLVGNTSLASQKSILERSDVPAKLIAEGMAIFREGRLIEWLYDDEARGVSWVNGKIKNTIVSLDCKDKKGAIAIEVIRTKTKIKARFQNDHPVITISIRNIGSLGELTCAEIDPSQSKVLRQLESEWNDALKKEVTNAVRKVQRHKTDVLGFGNAAERANPAKWKTLEKEWGRLFATCEFQVKVESKIRRTGKITKTNISDLKK